MCHAVFLLSGLILILINIFWVELLILAVISQFIRFEQKMWGVIMYYNII